MNVLVGRFFSDRYFVEKWIENMYSQWSLKIYLRSAIRDVHLNFPVPDYYWPDRIAGFIQESAREIQVDLDLLAAPSESRLPSSRHNSTDALAIRATGLEDVDEEFVLLVAQINAHSPRVCDLCHQSDHLVAQCPMITKLNLQAAKRILNIVLNRGKSHPYPSPSPSPRADDATAPTSNRPCTNPFLPIAQITGNGDDTAEDTDCEDFP